MYGLSSALYNTQFKQQVWIIWQLNRRFQHIFINCSLEKWFQLPFLSTTHGILLPLLSLIVPSNRYHWSLQCSAVRCMGLVIMLYISINSDEFQYLIIFLTICNCIFNGIVKLPFVFLPFLNVLKQYRYQPFLSSFHIMNFSRSNIIILTLFAVPFQQYF